MSDDPPKGKLNVLLTALIGIVVIPILLLLLPFGVMILEDQLFGTHVIADAFTSIHLDDVYNWLFNSIYSLPSDPP